MTDICPPRADWSGHIEDVVTHCLSDYRVPDAVSFRLELQLIDWLEANIESLTRSGRITLLPVRERACQCWPCTVPLPDEAPASPTSASAS